MVPSILINAAQGSKLVIGGAGGELIIPAVAQVSQGTPGWNIPPSQGQGGVGVGWLVSSLPVFFFPPPGHHKQAMAWL